MCNSSSIEKILTLKMDDYVTSVDSLQGQCDLVGYSDGEKSPYIDRSRLKHDVAL